jgi:spore germination protein
MKGLGAITLLLAISLAPAMAETANDKLEFAEIWAYLMAGEERFLSDALPVTDIGYFGAAINTFGKLSGVPDRARLKSFQGRVHLVVSEISGYSLTHFCLDPAYALRDALIADIVTGAEPFDGVQIDFEAVSAKDYGNFYAFLSLLKSSLSGKSLSVALPARMSERADLYGYERIGKLADRIIAMAYDEHWSSSEPGPVASIEWCRKAAVYAASKVDPAKLVMGLPFYGRAWADKSPSRAYKYSSLVELKAEKGIESVQREGGIPFMEYQEQVRVKVFFDDLESTFARLAMYRSAEVRNVAFWRLGQEDPGIWGGLAIAHAAPLSLAEASPPKEAAAPTEAAEPIPPAEAPSTPPYLRL